MIYLAAFMASLIGVGLKSTQQLQVVHYQYLRVIPVSYGMAAAEVFLISQIAMQGFGPSLVLMIFAIGTGAWIGAFCGMTIHKRLNNEAT